LSANLEVERNSLFQVESKGIHKNNKKTRRSLKI